MKIDARCCDTIRDFRNVITVFKASDIEIEEAEISEKLFEAYSGNRTYPDQGELRRERIKNKIVTLDGIPCKIEKKESAMSLLLSSIGSRGECKGCGLSIWWVKHNNGKNVPYTDKGLNHFIDCPKADIFRRKK